MAEDTSEQSCAVGLSTDDITPNVYEGGFKTWECSVDLAKYILTLSRAGNYPLDGQHHFVEVNPMPDTLPHTKLKLCSAGRCRNGSPNTCPIPVYLQTPRTCMERHSPICCRLQPSRPGDHYGP